MAKVANSANSAKTKQKKKLSPEDEKLFAAERGKREHQKLKSYLVLDYLMQETDEQHHVTIQDILLYLDSLGLEAEQRSVMDDIKEINYVLYMLEQECSIETAVEDLDSGEFDDEKFIRRSANRREYYVDHRRNDVTEDDVRLIAEALYTSKFLHKKKVKDLVKIVTPLVSRHSAQRVTHSIPELDRPRTTNQEVYWSVIELNNAMQDDRIHSPKKVTFRYQTHHIDDVEKTIDKRKGSLYKVSPFKLIINEGNYYLLAFDDESQTMRTYRVDRMKDVNCTEEPIDGEEEFAAIDLRNYTQRVFGMFGGERVPLTLLFDNCLLDTVVDRFGTRDIRYEKADEDHFTVALDVELSEQFYGWLCGFGDLAKIVSPESVAQAFAAHLDKIRAMY